MFSLGDKIIDEENSCLNSSWIDNNNENNSYDSVGGSGIDDKIMVLVEAGLMTKA